MVIQKPIWTDTYKVAWYEATSGNRASIVTLCNYFQETAWNHACNLGFDFRNDNEFEKAWVIVRLHLEINKFPGWGSTVLVQTWPRGYKGFMAFREFRIWNTNKELLAAATSSWLLINTKNRRPVHLSILDQLNIPITTQLACNKEAPSLKIPNTLYDFGLHKVRYYDLDMYQHVNNTRYIEMLISAYPDEWVTSHILNTMSIEFLKETGLGDTIIIKSDGKAAKENILIGKSQNLKIPLVRAKFAWD